MDYVYLNAPNPYAQDSSPRQSFSSSPTPFSAAPHKSSGLIHVDTMHAGQSLTGSNSLLSDTASKYQNTLAPAWADPGSRPGLKLNRETKAEKKVSSLYVACLSNSTASENSTGCAHDQTEGTCFGAEVTMAPAPNCISSVMDTEKALLPAPPSPPPPVPPRPFLNIVLSGDAVRYGESHPSRTPQAAEDTKLEFPRTADSEDRMRKEPYGIVQQQPQQQKQHLYKAKGFSRVPYFFSLPR